jgi:predicted nucleic-acid-binding protein
VLELVWVTGGKLRLGRAAIATMLENLLRKGNIVVESAEVVGSATQAFRRGKADFADCLIAASARVAGCSRTVTFDQIAARDAGMELLG